MLFIEEGNLSITGELTINNGAIYLELGSLQVSTNMNIMPSVASLETFFLTRSSSVAIGQDYVNEDGSSVYHEFSCITVNGNYTKRNCAEVFEKSCLTTGGDFYTSGHTIDLSGGFNFVNSELLYVVDAHFHVNGNFINDGLIEDISNVALGIPVGRTGFQTLWVEGNVINNNTWYAAIGQYGNYYIQNQNQIPPNQIYGTQRTASIIGSYFNNDTACSCN